MNDLTDNEKRDLVNREVTLAYSKMLQDEKRITSYNYKYFSDLLSFCLEQFLTKKTLDYQYKVAVVDKALLNYMGKSMALNLKSKSSPYWNQVRKASYNFRGVYEAEYENSTYKTVNFDLEELDDNFDLPIHQSDPVECISHAVENLDFYHKAIMLDYYFNNMTYNEMNKKYNITLISLKKAVDQGKQLIKEQCQHFHL